MASPLGWLRALLALLQQRFQSDGGEGWVEPGNEITRAILGGNVPLLAAPIQTPLASPMVASEPLVIEQTPLPQVEVAVAVELEVEAPAAALPDESIEAAEETPAEAPRKAGRAA